MVDLSTLRSGGLAPGIGKSGHSGAKFLAQQVAAAPLAKKDPRSVNGWGYSQMLINEGIFKIRKFDMIQSNSLQSLEVIHFMPGDLTS